jgi:hypothetical protein
MRDMRVAMAVSPDLLPVRYRLCQAILPGWMRVLDSPHSSMLLHHLGAMHRDAFRSYSKRMETECIETVVIELFERVEGTTHA